MEIFGVVVVVVCVASAAIGVIALARARRLYDSIGHSGRFWLSDEEQGNPPSPQALAEQDEEDVRQLLEAISAARRRRGEPPLGPEFLEQVRRDAVERSAARRD